MNARPGPWRAGTSVVPASPTTPQVVRFDALGVVDARGVACSPGSVLVRWERGEPAVVAVGRTKDIARHEAAGATGTRVVARPRAVLIPGLVNSHAHLDLTHVGPRPFDPERGFVGWIEMVRGERRTDPAEIARSVRKGIELSLTAGVVAVGDIGGAAGGRPNLVPWQTLRESGLAGVSFLEFFGIGKAEERARVVLERTLEEAGGGEPGQARLGLQPHAPNTVSSALFRRSVQVARLRGLPLATHLAETLEEREFVAQCTGPQRELLERLGIWDDAILADLGKGKTPVEHLEPVLRDAGSGANPFLVAHVNDASDVAIRALAESGTMVAYCPRASAYFGAERVFGAHRYRAMMRAGVLVVLGTDSIINLPADSAAGRGISILDEMRFLYARDGVDPVVLLRMATVNGARALGLDARGFAFEAGAPLCGLVAVGVVEENQSPPAAVAEGDLARLILSAENAVPELLIGANSHRWSGNSGS